MNLKDLFRQFTTPGKLRRAGVLGMNCRNFSYIMPENPRRLYPRVDDKLITKELARKAGIPVPELIGVIECQHEVKNLFKIIRNHPQFVIKPTHGSGGRGIMVVKEHHHNSFIGPDGRRIGFTDVYKHVSNILSGLYSLGGQQDKALIERCIDFTDVFAGFSYQGVPDVRIIIYKGYPVMAMMRLATAASGGRANLHQGAVGVGLNMRTGKALNAIQYGEIIKTHPDTGRDLSELTVPSWDEHLLIAAGSYEMAELGYFGADIVIDKSHGPMMLELNARPGLAIQTANGAGLKSRLEQIDRLAAERSRSTKERLSLALEHFA